MQKQEIIQAKVNTVSLRLKPQHAERVPGPVYYI
jgi:hypothetical protein